MRCGVVLNGFDLLFGLATFIVATRAALHEGDQFDQPGDPDDAVHDLGSRRHLAQQFGDEIDVEDPHKPPVERPDPDQEPNELAHPTALASAHDSLLFRAPRACPHTNFSW